MNNYRVVVEYEDVQSESPGAEIVLSVVAHVRAQTLNRACDLIREILGLRDGWRIKRAIEER